MVATKCFNPTRDSHDTTGRTTEGVNNIGWSGSNQIETNNLNLRAFVGTWNVGGRSPNNNLSLNDWLRTGPPADIYVLGFQEIVPLNAGNVLGLEDSGPARKWLSLIHQVLNCGPNNSDELGASSSDLITFYDDDQGLDNFSSLRTSSCSSEDGSRSFGRSSCPSPIHELGKRRRKYSLAASKQMVGIFLCVWVHEDLYKYVNSTKISCVGTGLMRCLGNKGSVSISMTVHQTSFCFVCTHLASGEREGDAARRNLDVVEILKRTRFSNSLKRHILDHDNIIWLGDLNYRLASISHNTYKLLEKNEWQILLQKDQLRKEQMVGEGVFKGWEEGAICFAPTYKYLANSDKYVVQISEKQKQHCKRTPAWCDRILWRGDGLKQMSYERGESRFSDHRPVYSLFSVHVNLHPSVVKPYN